MVTKRTITRQRDGLAEKANASQNSSATSEPVPGVSEVWRSQASRLLSRRHTVAKLCNYKLTGLTPLKRRLRHVSF